MGWQLELNSVYSPNPSQAASRPTRSGGDRALGSGGLVLLIYAEQARCVYKAAGLVNRVLSSLFGSVP
jgi:hypothetical protein